MSFVGEPALLGYSLLGNAAALHLVIEVGDAMGR
jgi:hypothetical protein